MKDKLERVIIGAYLGAYLGLLIIIKYILLDIKNLLEEMIK